MIFRIIFFISATFLSGCANIWHFPEGEAVPDGKAAIVFGLSVDPSLIKSWNGEGNSCFESAIASGCKMNETYLNVTRLSREKDHSTGKSFPDLNRRAYLFLATPTNDPFIIRLRQPSSRREIGVSQALAVKAPENDGLYYIGHITVDKNWGITISQDKEGDFSSLVNRYPSVINIQPQSIQSVIVPPENNQENLVSYVRGALN